MSPFRKMCFWGASSGFATNSDFTRYPHPTPFLYWPAVPTYHSISDPRSQPHSHTPLRIHPLLQYSNSVSTGHPCCPIKWDLRDPPQQARVHATPPQPSSPDSDNNLIASSSSPLRRLSHRELVQPATTPPVTHILITCGLFPSRWPIEVRKHSAVTIFDVLKALYEAANTPIHMGEWARLGPTEKRRFAQVYHQRCASGRPTSPLERGVMRVDCLAMYTRFAGISLVDGVGTSCVLTLDRNIHE